mmetsp:Transcript_12782/g.34850  ORF Transcript_12782/g.34850 Transcript_12782/m.34850 type:complete len:349 (+) Transcript_12782:64-1110(+)|eukprot:CAMPEP_0202355256 /NCGR_PEP_ID=MMETSP1126-20121109/10232_1 /ASSEMBLY_ACC=CAM_ASM_000457 /TAXON_ID=3047 /ORGANISM="Dunaliella tertiolecta, Strain CCMP1320" /LENGTH=348 /DNA_ID=CAMNT_0048947853 /DNA_START=66 /DNA_END=1112 /DNA_ORIENTATION=-
MSGRVQQACEQLIAPEASNLSPELSPERNWHEAFSELVTAPQTGENSHDDDLLFLVHSGSIITSPLAQPGPFTVCRKEGGPQGGLPEDYSTNGCLAHSIAWGKTFSLHLVLSTIYSLTVVTCNQESLPRVAAGQMEGPGVQSVTRRVFASPSYTPINLRRARADALPQPCYPDVCFVVDHEDEAFETMVIEHPDDAFCVLLHAQPHSVAASRPSPDQLQRPQQRIQLFSGYVTQRQVAAYLSSGGELDTRCRNRVVMNGPGGVGRSEVAVARVSDVPSRQGPTAKSHQHQQNLPLTEFFQKGVRTAMRFLGTPGGEVGLSNKLQCALLTVILPVDALARTIVLGSRAV